MTCIFCNMEEERIIAENDLAYVIYDGFPVTEYHSLIVSKNHAATYFDLSAQEREACHQLLVGAKAQILGKDPSVDGFNIGMNSGESAGQTIFHCHIHLIPRRTGDSANPRGGVRGVILNKADY